MILELVGILLSLAALCCTACVLYSRLLRPHTSQGTWAVVWGFGPGDGLEQRVRSLMWLQNCGLLRCSVVVADGGLDGNGRALAARLVVRYPGLTLCSRQELEHRLSQR